MKISDTSLPGVKLIEPRIFTDDRGFFFESWNARTAACDGLEASFVQDNHSCSKRGVLRGLHYQIEQPQGKLVRVIAGRALDAVVDIRRSSPHFGEWLVIELSADNRRELWVPPGFAHGFLALEDGTELVYKCTDFYEPAHDRTILWSDPTLAIAWPLEAMGAPTVSPKDAAGALLGDADLFA